MTGEIYINRSMEKAKHSVVQVNTYGISGGAGKAAYRLHKGLIGNGQNSKYLVKQIEPLSPGVVLAPQDLVFERNLVNDRLINKCYIWFNRTDRTNTYFSFSYPGYDISKNHLIRDADIINLHWTEDFLSPRSLNAIFSLNKPVVWTLHDQKPFTGGCHYSAGCSNYEDSCHACPQLANDPFGLPAAILKDKIDLFKGANLTIVTPSKWLAKEASKSTLFRSCRIESIPNSVETEIYFPVAKKTAKEDLGIDPGVITLMFGAERASEVRKGLTPLISAIRHCLKEERFKKLVDARKILILCVGKADETVKNLSIPVMDRGYISDDAEMAKIYNASDLFLLPSLEDNLPNTMLEAMACGTPVIAFNIGGMPDVITDDVNGRLIECGNDLDLARAMLDLIHDPGKRKLMGLKSSKLIQEKFKLTDQAAKYQRLYNGLLECAKEDGKSSVVPWRGIYGPHTRQIYPGMFQFSLRNMIRMRLGIDVRSKVAISALACLIRPIVKVVPNYFFMKWKNIFL